MTKVEEQETSTKANKRIKRISKTAIIFSAIFAVALLAATVYALTFTTHDQRGLFKANQEIERIPFSIHPNQAFNYNITLNQISFDSNHEYSIGQQETRVDISPTRNDISQWSRYFSYAMIRLNGTYEVSITIHNPDGKTISSRNESGNISSLENITLNFEFIKFGTYTLQIENLRGDEFNATLIPHGIYIIYEKPLFNYGIVGLTMLLLYPVLFFLSWNWTKKGRPDNRST